MPDARDQSRFLQRYAKEFHAGAFAVPTAKEIDTGATTILDWGEGDERVVAAAKSLTRPSKRGDFTGRTVLMPPGSSVLTHVARGPRAEMPDLDGWDYVTTYMEDHALSAQLRRQGRELAGVKVSAASEIIGFWGRGGDRWTYAAHDVATVAEIPLRIPPALYGQILAEVDKVTAWHDDFPYYSDGSWSAVSLRGFRRDDPTWGIKPAEMPRSWKQEHPEALAYECEWTILADQCPTIVDWIEACEWGGLERVRLLQMAGRGGKGGKLGRHTDITDHAAGTADGLVSRFHTPLITHPDIKMHTWDLGGRHQETHLEQWHTYYLDARKPHAVVNPTGVDRIHLVADVICTAETRARIAAGVDVRAGAA